MHEFDRRAFLQMAVAAGLVAMPGASVVRAQRGRAGDRKQRIVIIGGGAAGLASAIMLMEMGHEVTVLEAQSRPGGRILTLRDPFADGLYAEAGAARIPSNHALTLDWAKRYGLTTTPFYPSSGDFLAQVRGKNVISDPNAGPDLRSLPLKLTDEELAIGSNGMFGQVMGPLFSKVGDPYSADWPPAEIERLDHMTLYELFREAGFSEDASSIGALGFQDAARSETSALWMLRIMSMANVTGTLVKVQGGNDQIPRRMAQELGHRVHFNAPVVAVDQRERSASVTVQRPGGDPEKFECDRVICTAPFPVLWKIKFSPALPAIKRYAAEHLNYTRLSRVMMQTSDRPWRKQGLSGFAMTDIPAEVWDASWEREGQRTIVQLYIKERASARLEELSPEQRTLRGAELVGTVLPGFSDVFEGGVTKCWHEDPWAGGAHAEMTRGQITKFWKDIATAHGRVHFAGEHTAPTQAWIQGALESAERVVDEVNRA